MVMVDVCPYSLGTSVLRVNSTACGSQAISIRSSSVHRGAGQSRVNPCVTSTDNQGPASIDVYQGEARLVKDNILLGELNIAVTPRPAG